MISVAEWDLLTHRAWPARTTAQVGGWLARFSGGVTHRANSVLPLEAPADVGEAVAEVEALYRERGLAPTFQIGRAAQPAGLDEHLSARGYEARNAAVLQVAEVGEVLRRTSAPGDGARVTEAPDEDWTDLWWSVDGRGGDEAREIAVDILTATPALYASIWDGRGIAAVGRLALVDGWGGLHCMAVRPDARRRGHGQAVLRALLICAADHGIRDVWLQVLVDNEPARCLYEGVGFAPAANYHYRVLPRARSDQLREPDKCRGIVASITRR